MIPGERSHFRPVGHTQDPFTEHGFTLSFDHHELGVVREEHMVVVQKLRRATQLLLKVVRRVGFGLNGVLFSFFALSSFKAAIPGFLLPPGAQLAYLRIPIFSV